MIKQRVLYIGLGGSGIDLGLALDEAMKREICGLDGRQLLQRNGFGAYQPNEIPQFIQYFFLDFAQEALTNVKNILGSNNVTIGQQIVPIIDNYPALAADLRMDAPECVNSFIPPFSNLEPTTSPLSGGAGGFPTVGRAAFFDAMKAQTYQQTLGNDLQKVINKIAGSMGQLNTYSPEATDSVSIYVGFSMSGGTGCGLFLDVLQLLIKELMVHLQSTRVTIIPVVFFPSTFEGRLNAPKQLRAQLNMAQAILDLSRLIEHCQSPDANENSRFAIRYPDPTLGLVENAFLVNSPKMPVIAVVQKLGTTMNRADVERSIAASIVAQVSTVKDSADSNKNSFMEDIINDIPDISERHRLGLGTHLLMPMVAASLTLPSQTIADQIAKQIIVEGLAEQKFIDAQPPDTKSDSELEESLLTYCGLGNMVLPETFSGDTNVSFAAPSNVKSPSDLVALVNKVLNKIQSSDEVLKKKIAESLVQKTAFSFIDALKQLSQANPNVSVYRLARVANQTLTKLEVGPQSVETRSEGRRTQRKNFLKGLLPKRVTPKEVKEAVDKCKEDYINDVRKLWWKEWAERSNSWAASVDRGRSDVNTILQQVLKLSEESNSVIGSVIADLSGDKNGIINYVPTQGSTVEVALERLSGDTRDRVRSNLNIQDKSKAALLTALLSVGDGENPLARFIETMKNQLPQSQIHEEILRPIRNAVQVAMRRNEGSGQEGTLATLGELLVATAKDRTTEDGVSLLRVLGNLVPDTLIPPGERKSCKVLVSYPGDPNQEVEDMIHSQIALGGKFKEIIAPLLNNKKATGDNSIEFTATGLGDVLTVNINMIGQGLLDNPETRGVLQSWSKAVRTPEDESLQWRQRTGYKTINEIFGPRDRAKAINAVILGLAGGAIRVAEGTLENPTKLVLEVEDAVGAKALYHTQLELDLIVGCSSWPNIVPAFEQLVLGLDTLVNFQYRVVEKLMKFTPSSLASEDSEVPEVLLTMQSLRNSEINKLKENLAPAKRSLFQSTVVQNFESALRFWEDTFTSALKADLPAGCYYRTLETVIAESKKLSE